MNDLAFFISSKAQYWKDPANTIRGMIVKMIEIYVNYPGQKLSGGFMTLHIVMIRPLNGKARKVGWIAS
jgi:hypothetical protein